MATIDLIHLLCDCVHLIVLLYSRRCVCVHERLHVCVYV